MSKSPLVTTAFAAAFGLLNASPVFGQSTDIFVIVPGIPGNSVVVGYEDAIDVLALRQTFLPTTKGASPCSVEITKLLDRAGPLLWAAAATGQKFPEIRIDVVRAVEAPTLMYQVLLSEARIASLTTGVDDTSSEAVTMGGESMTLTFFTQTPTGGAGPGVSATISCK